MKRHSLLTPPQKEQDAVSNLVTKITGVLDNLIVTPGSFEAAQIEEIRQVCRQVAASLIDWLLVTFDRFFNIYDRLCKVVSHTIYKFGPIR